MVRMEGLEPPRLSAPEPKSGVSTNFTTSAKVGFFSLKHCPLSSPNPMEPIKDLEAGQGRGGISSGKTCSPDGPHGNGTTLSTNSSDSGS